MQKSTATLVHLVRVIDRLLAQPFLYAIVLYQKTLSPDHGYLRPLFPHGYCPYHPTCSQYGRVALGRYGLVKGLLKTLYRLLRCHPWTKGGIDNP